MKTSNLITLTAEEGHYIVPVNNETVPPEKPSRIVVLAVTDSADNYCEITEEEAQKVFNQIEQYRAARAAELEAAMGPDGPI